MNNTRSHFDEHGNAHYANTGRYNEVTIGAVNSVDNHSTSAYRQNLVVESPNSAAVIILQSVDDQLKKLIK